MDDLLTTVSTSQVKRPSPVTLIEESSRNGSEETQKLDLQSPEEISKALKNKPSSATLNLILRHLVQDSHEKDGFNLAVPGPISAQIVDTLITTTIPDFWPFSDARNMGKALVRCLQNANGLGALISRLRVLILDARQKKSMEGARDSPKHIEDLLDVFEHVLRGSETSSQIWKDVDVHAPNAIQKKLMWKEYVAQMASGRILSLVAEAEDILKEGKSTRKQSWLANGEDYATWLGQNVATLMKDNVGKKESSSAIAEICSKGLGLGYTDALVNPTVTLIINAGSPKILEEFLPCLKVHEQRKYLNSVIACITKQYLKPGIESKEDVPIRPSAAISGAAYLLHCLIRNNELLKDHVVTILVQSSVPALDESLLARRSVLAAIALDEDKLQSVLEKSIRTFGDSFYVKHTPILQQEILAQTLAIACGYVQRSQPMFLTMMAKSSYHTAGMSNRVGATSLRARFLGMAIGVAISKMVDKPELQLNFEFEGDEAVEAKWYEALTKTDDKMGRIEDFKTAKVGVVSGQRAMKHGDIKQATQKTANKKSIRESSSQTEITGPRIVELIDESSDEDDDLMPYEKPDSDPEDETDDPTEINRNKPSAPVYIRDLIVGLRDQEDYDRHQLAVSTAASLIRRKANFGTEVTDHIEQLASILTGLNENFDMPNFAEQRQQALIAVLLAKPGPMAQWFARSFFSGDYSLSQRIAMLSTLGLGARELAGLKDISTADLVPPAPSFPTKQLPPHLHKIYSSTSTANPNPVSRLTTTLTQALLTPLAANAADQLTGPSILKVGSSRTFSTRMAVEARRSKPIPNALAQIVADNFFFPLTGRWFIVTRSSTSSSSSGSSGSDLYTSPHLLPPLLQTLALLLHASGPSTLSLPQMTRELWDLLLSARGLAMADKSILSALLFAFLMLLETNEDKQRLATEHGKELLETQEWVRVVFEGLGAGSEEDERVRVLAAGVLVRCQEVVEKYQRRLAGRMMDY